MVSNLAAQMAKEISREYAMAKQKGDNSPNLYSQIMWEVINSHGIKGSDAGDFRREIARIQAEKRKLWKSRSKFTTH
jgi:hypothetical protein